MAAPTTPYVTATLASILAQNLFRGQVPGASTPITGTNVDQLITWTDGVIDSYFRSVGYVIPFVELSGETWPVDQTVLLQLMSAVGSMAMANGHVLLPAPRIVPGRESGFRSVWAVMADTFLTQIAESGFHFRAQYYLGTKAEKWLSEPYGPRTEFYDGFYDPARYQLLRKFTDTWAEVYEDMADLEIDWDYPYELTLAATN